MIDCNLVCASSYGASSVEEVIGKRLPELFSTIPGSLDKLFRETIENEYHVVDGIGIEKFPDGGDRYFLNNAHGVIENNKLVRIWGNFREITDRIKAEEKLPMELMIEESIKSIKIFEL